MKSFFLPALLLLLSFFHSACTQIDGQSEVRRVPTPDFNQYWFDGMAELSSYTVEQERYGEMRQAEKVLIFVTEDLSAAKQVKLDNPQDAGADRLPVLKLNTVYRFNTGIYDYSIAQSVFLPLDGSPTAKLACSVQDWCGHVYTQLNRTPKGYRMREFSYFEQEGEKDVTLADALLEDALWVMIRVNPAALPQGKQQLIPGLVHSRFRHIPLAVRPATLKLQAGTAESVYTIEYPEWGRTLRIQFETAFPHRITGWTEHEGEKRMSKGTLRRSMREAYWNKNDNDDLPLQDSLQWHF